VATGILAAPWNVFLSTLVTLGSGTPFNLDDQSLGGGINERRFVRNGARPEQFDFIIPNAWAYRSVDLRAEKQFAIKGTQRLGIAFEGVNVFSFDNFSEYDGFLPTAPNTNPMYGRPRNVLDPGRRLQIGLPKLHQWVSEGRLRSHCVARGDFLYELDQLADDSRPKEVQYEA
jgi:hypothetical protein